MFDSGENELNVCVLIPTYNNGKTLQDVVNRTLNFIEPQHVFIVNDGSTDNSRSIIDQFTAIRVFHLPENQGKGMALRKGFSLALDAGYSHIISIDSDGQHFPEDIPKLLQAIQDEPNTLFIGSRNMEQDDVPKKSSFGNRFSNFWFWFETGIQLRDTQSGFRVYPISLMPKKWFTKKFEFEIENIVRSAWKDIPVKNIDVQIQYQMEERVSHFRPFADFTRISILNTVLVFITLTYIMPRNVFRKFRKKKLKDFIKEDILGSSDSPKVKALSLALGVFIGIIPIWGFQTVASLGLATAFRLNKALTFAASNISIPPMIPVIVFGSLQIGSLILYQEIIHEDIMSITQITDSFFAYLIGSVILATATAFIVGWGSYLAMQFIRKKT